MRIALVNVARASAHTERRRARAVAHAQQAFLDALETHPYPDVDSDTAWDYAIDAAFEAKRVHHVSVYVSRDAAQRVSIR